MANISFKPTRFQRAGLTQTTRGSPFVKAITILVQKTFCYEC